MGTPEEGDARAATLRRISLHDQLVYQLRDMIMLGELPPGEPISEAALCSRFAISRTPLREALKVLASERLVALRAHRAPLVTGVAPEEIRETFAVLVPLERLAGRLATACATEADQLALAGVHQRLLGAHAAGDRAEYLRLNQRFHLHFARVSGNQVLLSTLSSLQDRVLRARALANRDERRWHGATREHEALIDAFARREPDLVADLLEEHLNRTAKAILAGLAALGLQETAR